MSNASQNNDKENVAIANGGVAAVSHRGVAPISNNGTMSVPPMPAKTQGTK